MNENKIKEAISSVEPPSGAKERMYRNIMNKAAKQTQKSAKPPVRLTRYALPIAACLCVVIVGLVHFLSPDTDIGGNEGSVMGGNPFVEVESADAFRELSITLDAPDGADNVSYAVIDGKIAQVTFSFEEKSYLSRASAQEGDFSGLNGDELSSETVDAENNAVLISLQSDGDAVYKLTWTNGKINCCLYGTDGAGRTELLSVYEAMKK